jgi:hypothetical protein
MLYNLVTRILRTAGGTMVSTKIMKIIIITKIPTNHMEITNILLEKIIKIGRVIKKLIS